MALQVRGGGAWAEPRMGGGSSDSQTPPSSPPPRRFGGRCGLLPAVLLRPDGLGALLSGAGLHREDDREEDRVGEAQGSPENPQATTPPPTVPTRPLLSAIQSRCCTITRRALARKDPREGVWSCTEGRPKAPDPRDD